MLYVMSAWVYMIGAFVTDIVQRQEWTDGPQRENIY